MTEEPIATLAYDFEDGWVLRCSSKVGGEARIYLGNRRWPEIVKELEGLMGHLDLMLIGVPLSPYGPPLVRGAPRVRREPPPPPPPQEPLSPWLSFDTAAEALDMSPQFLADYLRGMLHYDGEMPPVRLHVDDISTLRMRRAMERRKIVEELATEPNHEDGGS